MFFLFVAGVSSSQLGAPLFVKHKRVYMPV
nr:MAG TPA: hypothetical protein [Caudoviricetes sp.]